MADLEHQSGALLQGSSILLVEDDPVLAADLEGDFARNGASVIGPIGRLSDAERLWSRADAAVLDVNVRGELSFGLADQLIAEGTPVVFATGYDRFVIPERFRNVSIFAKPVAMQRLVSTVASLIRSRGVPATDSADRVATPPPERHKPRPPELRVLADHE